MSTVVDMVEAASNRYMQSLLDKDFGMVRNAVYQQPMMQEIITTAFQAGAEWYERVLNDGEEEGDSWI